MDAERKKLYILLGISSLFIGAGILFSFRGRHRMVSFARGLIGQTEEQPNLGFTNPEFENLMQGVGWNSGDQWCAYFVKMVWYNMGPDFLKSKIQQLFSGNVFETWDNLSNDPSFKVVSVPKAGDLAIFGDYTGGVATGGGHAGLVDRLGMGQFLSIEGNTNTDGSNNGYEVAENARGFSYGETDGLRLMGFLRIV